ncbi:MAG: DUF1819 family protein [Deltaproteobacteria bacterium]|nr:DUF1819 family protein [Deltaproteobacteria bacterium]
MQQMSRAQVVSSFTIIKGSLIEETYIAFQGWDFSLSKVQNLSRIKETNSIGATSTNWLRDVAFVLSRRFDLNGRDRSLVELAQAGCDREVWKPLLLWHMTRDEFLVRDFLVNWLFPQYTEGAYRLQAEDLYPYLEMLPEKSGIKTEHWTKSTLLRVASGLLRIAVDFGLMTGAVVREFTSYHLPESSFLYLVHAMAEQEHNANQIVHSPDWRLFLMAPEDVERELFRLHQYRKLHYDVAGSLAQLTLPHRSVADYAKELAL